MCLVERHQCITNASRCCKDALLVANAIRDNVHISSQQPCWEWHEVRVEQDCKNLHRVNGYAGQERDPSVSTLKQAARMFVEKQLGVGPGSTFCKNPRCLLERSCSLNFSQKTPVDEFNRVLQDTPSAYQEIIRRTFHNALRYLVAHQAAIAANTQNTGQAHRGIIRRIPAAPTGADGAHADGSGNRPHGNGSRVEEVEVPTNAHLFQMRRPRPIIPHNSQAQAPTTPPPEQPGITPFPIG